jgi:tRNA nucleotidyltransferase (CCA-adding enzyme)
MSMTASERRALLSQWVKPSSESEQVQQDRAERMIRDAINAHPTFKGTAIRVYAKGSYANNTNVRLDSDVDIVVENHDCFYYDYFGDFPDRLVQFHSTRAHGRRTRGVAR